MVETAPERVPPQPKRRWYQYSLRTLLILVTLVAVGLSSWLEWQRRRRLGIAREWAQACLDQQYPDFDDHRAWDSLSAGVMRAKSGSLSAPETCGRVVRCAELAEFRNTLEAAEQPDCGQIVAP